MLKRRKKLADPILEQRLSIAIPVNKEIGIGDSSVNHSQIRTSFYVPISIANKAAKQRRRYTRRRTKKFTPRSSQLRNEGNT